jgi:hypothetical protein
MTVHADSEGIRKIQRLSCQSNVSNTNVQVNVNIGYDIGTESFLGCPTVNKVHGFFVRFNLDTHHLALHCQS